MTSSVLPSDTIYTGIKGNWTRTRPSFLRGLARHLEYAEYKCFGLILQSTVGTGRPWAKIPWKRFCDVVGVTRRRCEQAISSLRGKEDEDRPGVYLEGLIRERKAATGGGTEYSISPRTEISSETAIARCRDCGTVGEVDLDPDFIPIPHSAFLSLAAACDHGMYLVVITVIARTMRWDKETKQIVVVPCEITIEEFERATGKKRAEILSDLQKVQAEGYQFIGSESAGRGKRYWARPENFASAPARAAREVKQPKERKKRETVPVPNPAQPVEHTRSIRPVEFVTVPCGVCRHCQCYGPVDIVSESQQAPKKPLGRSREGPENLMAPGKPYVAPWKIEKQSKKGELYT